MEPLKQPTPRSKEWVEALDYLCDLMWNGTEQEIIDAVKLLKGPDLSPENIARTERFFRREGEYS